MKQGEQWISISDLMSVLMMVFLFISIALLVNEQSQNKKIKEKIKQTEEISKKINSAIDKEFRNDFKDWKVEKLRDGTIRFQSPKIMFLPNKHKLKKEFTKILDDFCPRFINLMYSKFSKEIHEIKITGHSSKEFNTRIQRFRRLRNAQLSILRAWEVHRYCYDSLKKHKEWFSSKVVTIGANYVHTIKAPVTKKENKKLSRRVEFKVIPKKLSDIEEYFIKVD
ncbi:MAG: OmpA family protein [Halobacteriovoraceae bacterium]|nr:OmpA family protein [Halobacteriovoraceae bacterium]